MVIQLDVAPEALRYELSKNWSSNNSAEGMNVYFIMVLH